MKVNLFILFIACILSGYGIGDIGSKLKTPLWISILLSTALGWYIGDIAQELIKYATQ